MMRSAHSTRPTKIATAEFCASLSCICFRDPTGPAAGPSSKDRNVFSENLFEGFAERRPAYGHDGQAVFVFAIVWPVPLAARRG